MRPTTLGDSPRDAEKKLKHTFRSQINRRALAARVAARETCRHFCVEAKQRRGRRRRRIIVVGWTRYSRENNQINYFKMWITPHGVRVTNKIYLLFIEIWLHSAFTRAQPLEYLLQMNWNETICVCLRALASRRRQNPPFRIQMMRIQSESRAENNNKSKNQIVGGAGKMENWPVVVACARLLFVSENFEIKLKFRWISSSSLGWIWHGTHTCSTNGSYLNFTNDRPGGANAVVRKFVKRIACIAYRAPQSYLNFDTEICLLLQLAFRSISRAAGRTRHNVCALCSVHHHEDTERQRDTNFYCGGEDVMMARGRLCLCSTIWSTPCVQCALCAVSTRFMPFSPF